METVARARTLRLPRTVSPRAEPLAALARCCYPDMAVYVEEEDDPAAGDDLEDDPAAADEVEDDPAVDEESSESAANNTGKSKKMK